MKSSNSRANGSEEDLQGLSFKAWSTSKSRLLIPSFTRKLTIKFGLWVGHLNTAFGPGERELRGTSLRKFKCPGGCLVGLWSFAYFETKDRMFYHPFKYPATVHNVKTKYLRRQEYPPSLIPLSRSETKYKTENRIHLLLKMHAFVHHNYINKWPSDRFPTIQSHYHSQGQPVSWVWHSTIVSIS